MTSVMRRTVALTASGCSKQITTPERIVIAEKNLLRDLSELFLTATPPTRPIQKSTPAISSQHLDMLDFPMAFRRSWSKDSDVLCRGGGAMGYAGKERESDDVEYIEPAREGRVMVVENEALVMLEASDDRCVLMDDSDGR